MLKKIMIGGGVAVAVVGGFLADTVIDAGALKDIEPHFHGQCDTVRGVVGAEDITIDPDSGFAYISSHDRRTWTRTGSADGNIFLYRPGSLARPLPMPHDFEGPFHPHGIAIWRDETGPDRLFVVNHPDTADGPLKGVLISSQIEIFDIDGGTLKHIRTVTPEAPYSLNDVVAIGPDSFYASIDKGSETRFGRQLESYGRLSRGGIAYGDKNGMQKLTDGLVYPNGIQWDGVHLMVAETTGERLLAFKQGLEPTDLKLVAKTDIDSGLDNLEWDTDGNLWIGAHPRAIDFPGHAADPLNRSPSQVLKVTFDGAVFDVTEVYLNDGNPLSGSSVAAPFGKRLLIGSVFEPYILDCGM
ncbi:MAG: SMP-30/gluconolactonase/LRE family protein [Alphaproteobacteria bacterium]|nr:SMP-30/gluconolactonase/LRE family protein [Alphaproteobacteria bacterium]